MKPRSSAFALLTAQIMRSVVYRRGCAIFLGLLFAVSCPPQSSGFEAGFCERKSHPERYDAINEVYRNADLSLCFKDDDKFLCKFASSSGSNVTACTHAKLQALAKSQKNKRLLVVIFPSGGATFAKFNPSQIDRIKEQIKSLTPFFNSLGYARVLMLTPSSNSLCLGWYVVEDRTLSPAVQVKLPSRP